MYRYIALVVLLVAGSGFITEALRRQQRESSLENFTPQMQAEFDRLARLIRDSSPERRADAVEGLRALGNLEALPLLIDALRDPNKDVVIRAISALEHFDYRIGAKGCGNLLRLTRNANSEIHADAERAAMRLCDWRAAPLIIAELERPDCDNRQFLFALLQHCTSHVIPPTPEQQTVSQSKPSEGQKQQASDAYLSQAWKDWFAKYRDGVPADWLIDDLGNSTPEGRALAAEALGRLHEKKAAKPLAKAIRDKDEKVCLKALEALRLLQAKDAVPAISALYLTADGARAAACETAMVRLASYMHIQALAADLAQADSKKRGTYVRLLEIASGHKTPEGVDAAAHWSEYAARVKGLAPLELYARELKDKEPRNRFEAARRLAKFGQAAVPYLLDALEDEAPTVRAEAAKSLKAMTFYYVEYNAEGSAEERQEGVKKWREWWQSKMHEKPVQRLITQLQNRRDQRNQVEAAIGLREIDAWQAVPYLINALSDENEALRFYAGCALDSVTAQSFDFVSNAPPDERDKAIRRWKSWWGNGKSDKEAALIETIRNITVDKSAKIRAIKALAGFGSKRSAIALSNLLDDQSFVLSSVSEEALEKVTGKAFFHATEDLLSDHASTRSMWRKYLVGGKEA